MGRIADELRTALARGNAARYVLRGEDESAAWTWQGESMRLLELQIPQVEALEAASGGEDGGEPEPEPEPDGELWGRLLSGAPCLMGRQKWLAGSTGADLFCPRGTLVTTPHNCTIRFERVAGGPLLIGQMFLFYPDGRTVRYRHVEAEQASGDAPRGQVVARVMDASMDLLRWPSWWRDGEPYPRPPDGYQHLDLSLASSPERLNPQGGAGGDVDADAHLLAVGGLPNLVLIGRTPGPPEGLSGAPWAERAAFRRVYGDGRLQWAR